MPNLHGAVSFKLRPYGAIHICLLTLLLLLLNVQLWRVLNDDFVIHYEFIAESHKKEISRIAIM